MRKREGERGDLSLPGNGGQKRGFRKGTAILSPFVDGGKAARPALLWRKGRKRLAGGSL